MLRKAALPGSGRHSRLETGPHISRINVLSRSKGLLITQLLWSTRNSESTRLTSWAELRLIKRGGSCPSHDDDEVDDEDEGGSTAASPSTAVKDHSPQLLSYLLLVPRRFLSLSRVSFRQAAEYWSRGDECLLLEAVNKYKRKGGGGRNTVLQQRGYLSILYSQEYDFQWPGGCCYWCCWWEWNESRLSGRRDGQGRCQWCVVNKDRAFW